jgi:hypothetical protein
MNEIRRRLTLFLNGKADSIESVRAKFNPVQFDLIPAHITLCREDEIEQTELEIRNINTIFRKTPIFIKFDAPRRFAESKDVFIPAQSENAEFHELRENILGLREFPRIHLPHITLMHPRNSTCTDQIFDQIKAYDFPTELGFDKISLIEQINGGKWQILEEFSIVFPYK